MIMVHEINCTPVLKLKIYCILGILQIMTCNPTMLATNSIAIY